MKTKRFLQMFVALACVLALTMTGFAQDAPKAKGKGKGKGKKGDRGANVLTAQEQAEGWQLLFDGKEIKGWRGLGLTTVPQAFVVENGTIHKVITGKSGVKNEGDLITEKTYDNFEFAFDWKIAKGSNNGVKYNVSEELSQGPKKTGHASLGFEYQVLDDVDGGDKASKKHQCGSLYELFAADDAKKHVNPIGQWNSSKIVFNGNHIEHWLNGEKIVEQELGSPEMNAAIAASKWKNIKEFGTRKTGVIAITDHQDEAWYRNLKIRELPRK